jgi:hypothetical protein
MIWRTFLKSYKKKQVFKTIYFTEFTFYTFECSLDLSIQKKAKEGIKFFLNRLKILEECNYRYYILGGRFLI